jgi:phosphate transport system substrate-binding protein
MFLAFSCRPNDEETATKGHLRVLVAESVAPVLVQEVNKFLSLYQAHGADVKYTIVQSREANARFVNDTARVIITTIPLTSEEKDRVRKTTDNLVEIKLAYDGIVAIVQKRNPREDLTLEQIRNVLNGRVTTWEQLGRGRLGRGRIHLFLEDSSDVSKYLSGRILGGNSIKATFHRVSSSSQTVEDVSKDRYALGFVGLNWVDSVDGKIKVLSLAADSAVADTTFRPPRESIGNAYTPHPAHIYLNYYPMKRAIYVYSRTTPGDFATGFTSFLASPAGQRLFLNAGLVPGTQQIVLKRPGQN